MKDFLSKRKFLLILLTVILVCISIIVVFNCTSKDTKEIVDCQYNNGTVIFQINPDWQLTRIQLNYGIVKLPKYDANTKTISFNINEIEKEKSEFFTFICNKKNSTSGDSVTYEIIRELTQVVVMRYKHNVEIDSVTYRY